MGLVNLEIKPRSTFGKNANRRNRTSGHIPAVLYGKDRETESIELDTHSFSVALMHLAGRTALFALNGDEDNIALVREVQRNPVTDEILHVDLMSIPRGVPVTVPVTLEVVGECAAVKAGDASVAMSLDRVDISVRPRDMPEYLEIDISEMDVNDKVFVGDIKLETGEVITDPELLVLNIKPSALVLDLGEEGEEGEEGAEEGAEAGESADGEDKKDDA
jgi:large subunit ribosomal protein L25